MRKALLGSLLVASLAMGSVAVAAVNPISAVSAAVNSSKPAKGSLVQQSLDEEVANGTITQAQADAIESALQAKREALWAKRPGLGKAVMASVAQQLNTDLKALVAELRTGKSIADVANEKGVNPQSIIDNLVTSLDGKIDARVAAKTLTQNHADVMKQNLPARVADFVNKIRGHARAAAKAQTAPPTTDTTSPSTEAPTTTAPDSTTTAPATPGTGGN